MSSQPELLLPIKESAPKVDVKKQVTPDQSEETILFSDTYDAVTTADFTPVEEGDLIDLAEIEFTPPTESEGDPVVIKEAVDVPAPELIEVEIPEVDAEIAKDVERENRAPEIDIPLEKKQIEPEKITKEPQPPKLEEQIFNSKVTPQEGKLNPIAAPIDHKPKLVEPKNDAPIAKTADPIAETKPAIEKPAPVALERPVQAPKENVTAPKVETPQVVAAPALVVNDGKRLQQVQPIVDETDVDLKKADIEIRTLPPKPTDPTRLVSTFSSPMIAQNLINASKPIANVAEDPVKLMTEADPIPGPNTLNKSEQPVLQRFEAPIQTAKSVSQQIANAVVQTNPGTTEIKLSPEELGRVRMTVQTIEGVIHVAIAAERPDTSDLMRRNAEMLASELREMGFDSVSLSFENQSDTQQDTDSDQGASTPASLAIENDQPVLADIVNTGPTSGLDLRI